MARPGHIVWDVRMLDGPLLRGNLVVTGLTGPLAGEKIYALHRLLIPAGAGQKPPAGVVGVREAARYEQRKNKTNEGSSLAPYFAALHSLNPRLL